MPYTKIDPIPAFAVEYGSDPVDFYMVYHGGYMDSWDPFTYAMKDGERFYGINIKDLYIILNKDGATLDFGITEDTALDIAPRLFHMYLQRKGLPSLLEESEECTQRV